VGGRTYSCWMLNCRCTAWPVGVKRLISTKDYMSKAVLNATVHIVVAFNYGFPIYFNITPCILCPSLIAISRKQISMNFKVLKNLIYQHILIIFTPLFRFWIYLLWGRACIIQMIPLISIQWLWRQYKLCCADILKFFYSLIFPVTSF
jgi:hypothetical protein